MRERATQHEDTDLTLRTKNVDQFLREHAITINHPHVLILSGAGVGEHHPLLPGQSLLVGRSAMADISLKDPGVSRVHTRIESRLEGIFVRDLDSLNGTYVNGERVLERQVEDGDRIHIGQITLLQLVWKKPSVNESRHRLYDLAAYDEATGTRSWGFFVDVLRWEFDYHRDKQQPLSLVLLCCDGIEVVRKSKGECLRLMVVRYLGESLMQFFGRNALVGCKDDSTFGVLLRNTDDEDAIDRVRDVLSSLSLHELDVCPEARDLEIFSGIATAAEDYYEDVDSLIRAAEERLQAAFLILKP
jgi:two-component system cell cycle response regulator